MHARRQQSLHHQRPPPECPSAFRTFPATRQASGGRAGAGPGAKGGPWDWKTCYQAVYYCHVGLVRWLRENGCPWDAVARDLAASPLLRYTDDFGNLVDDAGNPIQ